MGASMMSLPENWMKLMDDDALWIIMNVQPSGKPLVDIQTLLHWFDENSLTAIQLEDALEEYVYHNDIRFALIAARHEPLNCD
jgi:hypothetical protein